MSLVTLLLILSMLIEYTAIEAMKIYLALSYLGGEHGYFVVLLVPALALVGPATLGPIAGIITDRISARAYPVPLAAVAMWAPLIMLPPTSSPVELRLAALVVLSVLAYLSANIRIASSRHLVPQAEYATYHSAVVWILQIVPIAAPFFAGLLLNLRLSAAVAYGGGISILLIGVLFFAAARRLVKTAAREPSGAEVAQHSALAALVEAIKFVLSDRDLSRSVVVAALVNVTVFVGGYAGVAAFDQFGLTRQGAGAFFPGTPLAAMGVGALLGSLIVGPLRRRYPDLALLEIMALTSIAFLLAQALLISNALSLVPILGIGAVGGITSVIAWGIRLQRSRADNIGTLAGVTGAAYKIPSLLILPVISFLAGASQIQAACLAALGIVTLAYFASFRIPALTRRPE